MSMFLLGFISAFAAASIIVMLWFKWDSWQQMKELDRENTEKLLDRVLRLEALSENALVRLGNLEKGGKRG